MEPWSLTIACLSLFIGIVISVDLYRGIAPLSRPFFRRVATGVGLIGILILVSFIKYVDVSENLAYYTLAVFLLGLVYWLWLRRNRIKDDDRLELIARVDPINEEAE